MKIALLGSTGFVGRNVARAIRSNGHTLITHPAPRLRASSTTASAIDHTASAKSAATINNLLPLAGADAIINAAGLSDAQSSDEALLYGANALLPAIIAVALPHLNIPRFVHISSAAVHGSEELSELAENLQPLTPYGRSKLAGEQAVARLTEQGRTTVIYRPTSVQGIGRPLTSKLVHFARSPLSSVAGDGSAPTPQALVENVATAAVFLAETHDAPEHPVIHPYEGQTTASLLTGFGGTPKHIPERLARATVAMLSRTTAPLPRLRANVRRLEMLWLGQTQHAGWFEHSTYRPTRSWDDFFREIAEAYS